MNTAIHGIRNDWIPSHLAERVDVGSPLAPITWFRVGGPATYLFRPKTVAELKDFVRVIPADISHISLGVGSNVLIRDGGVDGVVIRLGGGFARLSVEGKHKIRAGAAALDVGVARFAAKHEIAGLEFFRGIPGTIGGALRMNAGAYGREMKDVLVEAKAVDRAGNIHSLTVADLKYAYRSSGADPEIIFTEALLQGAPGDPAEIAGKMEQITEARESSQPVRSRTGGSTFKNPPSEVSDGRRAWELIDEAGCRGMKTGDAQVSEQHCNFLINLGDATSRDLEMLGETVRKTVLEKTSVTLEWEIKRIGREGAND